MQQIEYTAPKTLKRAIAILAANGEKARMLAGGTDILVQLRSQRRRVSVLVDAKTIPQLNRLSYTQKGGLTLGAAVPCYRVYQDATVNRVYPGLIDAAELIGGIQIQGRASIGGNLCNSAPSGDCIPALIVLGAVCNIIGPDGPRQVPAATFCTGPGRNVLQPNELLVSINLPTPVAQSGAKFLRFIPRNEMDIAVANVATWVTLDRKGQHFTSARIALGSVAPTPVLATAAAGYLVGKAVSEEVIEKAGELAKKAAKPITDMRGTIDQRVHLVGVLTRRTLNQAIERARNSH